MGDYKSLTFQALHLKLFHLELFYSNKNCFIKYLAEKKVEHVSYVLTFFLFSYLLLFSVILDFLISYCFPPFQIFLFLIVFHHFTFSYFLLFSIILHFLTCYCFPPFCIFLFVIVFHHFTFSYLLFFPPF